MLHQVLRAHLETFRAAAAQRGEGTGLPRFVERELREFLGYLAGAHLCRCAGPMWCARRLPPNGYELPQSTTCGAPEHLTAALSTPYSGCVRRDHVRCGRRVTSDRDRHQAGPHPRSAVLTAVTISSMVI